MNREDIPQDESSFVEAAYEKPEKQDATRANDANEIVPRKIVEPVQSFKSFIQSV